MIDQAITLAKVSEGLRLKPYLCPAGVASIGYGATRYPDGRHVTLADPEIDVVTAEVLLREEMNRCAAAVMRMCPEVAHSESKLSALADFSFNLGTGRLQASTLRRRVNQRDWRAAAAELRKWVHGGGRVLPGLVIRREAEAALLLA